MLGKGGCVMDERLPIGHSSSPLFQLVLACWSVLPRQALTALVLILASTFAHAQPTSAHLTHAQIWPSSSTAWSPPPSLSALDMQDAPLLNAATPWRAVALPHASMRARWIDRLSTPATDEPEVLWYRLQAPAGALAPQGTRLYIPRWQTVGTVAVYVNGRMAWQSGERVWNSFNHPVWADLTGLIEPGKDAFIHVRMASQPGVGGALTSLWVGPSSDLLPRWRWRSFLQTDLVGYWRGSFLMLGLFALGVAAWLQKNRGDVRPFVLFFGMAVGQSMAALLYLVSSEGLDIAFTWFTWMTMVALMSVSVCAFYFLGVIHHRPRPHLGIALLLYAAAAALTALPVWWHAHAAVLPLLRLLLVPPVLVLLYAAISDACYLRSRASVFLAAWGILSLPMGLHDMLMQGYRLNMEGLYLTPYVNLGLLTVFVYLAFTRYTDALQLAARARGTLAVRLAAQERELLDTHEKLRTAEREQTLLHERQRLMREMHDGVGSSLMSALRLVERGPAHGSVPLDVAQVLKECIDDLKIAIDSLECVDADLLSLLGALRYRLGRRLGQAGIALQWHMSDLPALPWLDAQSALHVLRILQEVLTNIVKHSGAVEIILSTSEAPSPSHPGVPGVEVRVQDNGHPFIPPESLPPGRRGLSNVRSRARALGTNVTWVPKDNGTVFTLWLPLLRDKA